MLRPALRRPHSVRSFLRDLRGARHGEPHPPGPPVYPRGARACAEATGTDTSAFAMYVGQCINTPDGAAATVEEFDCNQPHTGEVFYIHKLTDATRPSDDDMEKKATDACLAAFSPYVGKDYEDSSLSIVWMYPTVQTWTTGDREIVCIATTDDDSTLNQSIKGSGM